MIGSHARSPNTSMWPKPSVVMSMVVRTAGSWRWESRTYQPWKKLTRIIESVMVPVVRSWCMVLLMFRIIHNVSPGRSSQKDLRSSEERRGRGLSSRPINQLNKELGEVPPSARRCGPGRRE